MKSSEESRIDFTRLPIEETAVILRRLIDHILDKLLDPGSKPGQPPGEVAPLELAALLTGKEIQLLDSASIWVVKRKGFRQRIKRNFRDELPRALRKVVKKSVSPKKKVSAFEWQIGVSNRLSLACGGTAGDGLPDGFWPLVAKAAWCEPGFQHSTGMKIVQWLRSMRLFYPYQIPVANFTLSTFWVLIAMMKPKPLKWRCWISKKERAGVRVCRRLFREAHMQAMVNGWADFWDQWLIRLAVQRWPEGIKGMDTRLCRAILALPLLVNNEWSKTCTGKGKIKIYNRTLAERVCDFLDGVKRRRRPPREFHRAALLYLAAPGWEERVPEMFNILKSPFDEPEKVG